MPRGARLDTPGSLHHVMVRGIERSGIALEDKDRKDDVKRIGKEAENNKTVIYVRKSCWGGCRSATDFMGRHEPDVASLTNLMYWGL